MTTTLLKKNSPYQHWEFSDHETGNRVRIVPERGGLITEWLCNGKEVLYFDLERFNKLGKSVRGGIPILFPICGNLPDNRLLIDQSEFIINQHGFARDIPWDISLIENHRGFSLSLYDSEITKTIFPYSFSIVIEVELTKNTLDFLVRITNITKKSMPFSFGLHPYFNIQDLAKINLEGLQDQCQNNKIASNIETSRELENLKEGVDFLVEGSQGVVLHDLISGDRLQLRNEAPMDLTVIWTDPPRNMICIEPWTSPRGSLLTGQRRIMLDYQKTKELKCQFLHF